MKKTVAFILSLSMAVSMAACGGSSDSSDVKNEPAASREQKAGDSSQADESQESSSQDISRSDESEQSKADSSSDSKTESAADSKADSQAESKPDAGQMTEVRSGDVHILCDKYSEDIQTDKLEGRVIDDISADIIAEYRCGLNDDFENYFKYYGVDKVVTADKMKLFIEDDIDYDSVRTEVLSEYVMLIIAYMDELYADDEEKYEAFFSLDDDNAIISNVEKQAKSIDLDLMKTCLADDYMPYDELVSEIEACREDDIKTPADGNIRSFFEVTGYETDGGTTYVTGSLYVLIDDVGLEFEDIYAWWSEDGHGAFAESTYIEDELEEAALTDEELMQLFYDSEYIDDANTKARYAWRAVANYLSENGLSFEEAVARGDFAEMNSSAGINIKNKGTGSGEKAVLEELESITRATTAGDLYVGALAGEDGDFFVQYRHPEGVMGQYPHPLYSANSREASFGTYY